ncbi:MAG: hypothetical protein A2Y57_00965 [Candidatus Woykebacteria bacterium RBG_13_40_7b]|uniref:Nudix hydrolase domain-containing protein n=1 Tax=Candidatus Woykebacteria bacterium RBG_13_40_7b TaxID=1802594 RepID=A0A1G1WC12_9BACT|nr:MAG: hypothetical protein A2Y57_00965 [Candidatus Woykebacteria bacterium RBG_13_40_7b]
MKRGPFEVLKSEKIYQSRWIKVRKDQIVYPAGWRGNYTVVELKGGAGVVSINEKGEIYLVGQYRYAPNIYSWEIPKGSLTRLKDPNILETAKQELKEETGLTASHWKKLTTVHTLLGSTNDKVHLFLATGLQQGIANPEKTEADIQTQKVSWRKFYKMVEDGEITDATSIAAVLLTKLRYPDKLK